MEKCSLCPRNCLADRSRNKGMCGAGKNIRIARVGLHEWEEPCISFKSGSGTVFFSGCSLKCVFCQNREISKDGKGTDISVSQLSDEFLKLQDMGAENINLVTPTHYAEDIIKALDLVKHKLSIPVCYNCGGYESTETLKKLEGYIDIFMPDIKYFSPVYSEKYSGAKDYFEKASTALEQMYKMTGYAEYSDDGKMLKGVLTRHLVLPGLYKDSMTILGFLSENYEPERFALSLMSQYFPTEACKNYPEINRRVTSLEYNKVVSYAESLGFKNTYIQDRSSAERKYVPDFDYRK